MSQAVASRACGHCSTVFEYPVKRKNRKYCSTSCRSKATATPERMRAMRAQVKNPHSGSTNPRPCVACGEVYEPASARQQICGECTPDKSERARLRRYGLTQRQWRKMVERYDGMCWVCRKLPASCLDHDHVTGKNRGAVCRGCNMALHYVERPGWWDAARAYLAEGEEVTTDV